MNSNRSLKSNTNIPGRQSPSSQLTNPDSLPNRSASPVNNRLPYSRDDDGETNARPVKILTESDRRFHRAAFERCANLPNRELITSREKFVLALSYVGYDLPKSKMDELWSDLLGKMTLKNFERILADEKPVDQRMLEEAFESLYNKDRKSDWNNVDYNRFRTDMIENGDRFTEDEFEKIRRLLGTDNGKVDVKKLTKMVEENKTTCREKIFIEQKDELERPSSARINSPRANTKKNSVSIIIEPESKKLLIPPKTRPIQMKGAFFCEYYDSPTDVLYFSIGYSFETKRNTPICIIIEPVISHYHQNETFKHLDTRLFLFEKVPHSTERRLLHVSAERSGNKSYLQLNDLPKGSYEILPVTFGGVLRARSREVNERPPIKKLRETIKEKKFTMSSDYRTALEYVFDVFDFNDNKQLERQEYNLWTIRTTGEEITDDDWQSIRAHVRLDEDEGISKKKFLELNETEAENEATSEQELWVGLKTIGFNYALEVDMMCPFNLTMHINDSDVHMKPTSYVELDEIKKILIKFLKNKGKEIRINNPSIHCFNYQDDCGSILFAENRSASNVRLSIQVTQSINTALNLPNEPRKPPVVNIRRDTTQIIWFAHKLDNQRGMELEANIEAQ